MLYVIPSQSSVVFSTLFATMISRSSFSTAHGGCGRGYRPSTMTFDNPVAPVPEGTNENSPSKIDNPVSIRIEFSPTADTPILKVLSSFLDALSGADHLATLYNSKQTQFFQTSTDLPIDINVLRSQFPVRQFQRGHRPPSHAQHTPPSQPFARMELGCRPTKSNLRKMPSSLLTSKIPSGFYIRLNIRPNPTCTNSSPSKSPPSSLTKTKHKNYNALAPNSPDNVPPFSLHLCRRYCIDVFKTTCVILRTDAVAANFYEILLRNINDLFEISPNEMIVVRLKLVHTNGIKAVACIRIQNKFLDETISLPLVGPGS
jgi:hypothetical protein